MMDKVIEFYINDLNKLIAAKKRDLEQCEKKLSHWENYIVRVDLRIRKLELQEDLDILYRALDEVSSTFQEV